MATFDYAVVTVPFPYVETAGQKRRPAVMIARPGGCNLCWVVMVTSASNRPWPGDIALVDPNGVSGLRSPSVIRPAKIAAIEGTHVKTIGLLPDPVAHRLRAYLAGALGLAVPT